MKQCTTVHKTTRKAEWSQDRHKYINSLIICLRCWHSETLTQQACRGNLFYAHSPIFPTKKCPANRVLLNHISTSRTSNFKPWSRFCFLYPEEHNQTATRMWSHGNFISIDGLQRISHLSSKSCQYVLPQGYPPIAWPWENTPAERQSKMNTSPAWSMPTRNHQQFCAFLWAGMCDLKILPMSGRASRILTP